MSKTTTLRSQELSCPSCIAKIERELGQIEGVENVDVRFSTGRIIEVPVGDAMIGRVVDALGQPIDGKGPIATTRTRPVERVAPGVVLRQPVNTPVQTGLKAIDAMIPIDHPGRESGIPGGQGPQGVLDLPLGQPAHSEQLGLELLKLVVKMPLHGVLPFSPTRIDR